MLLNGYNRSFRLILCVSWAEIRKSDERKYQGNEKRDDDSPSLLGIQYGLKI
jgi:hypothetical protein